MILSYVVEIEFDQFKICDFLKLKGVTDNSLKEIAKGNGQLLVNDMVVMNYYIISFKDKVEVVLPTCSIKNSIIPVNHPFEILYEDSYMLVINKESNVATIPTRKYYKNSLANYVLCYYLKKGILANVHFVSRLDEATSGIIICSKSPGFVEMMKQCDLVKKYLLEVTKSPSLKEGEISGYIQKDATSIIKRQFDSNSHSINSITKYRVLKEMENKTLIEATLVTGKTHQLRIHFSSIGSSIIGDELYGEKSSDGILHLHSYNTSFVHPITKVRLEFQTLPKWVNPLDLK